MYIVHEAHGPLLSLQVRFSDQAIVGLEDFSQTVIHLGNGKVLIYAQKQVNKLMGKSFKGLNEVAQIITKWKV